MENKGGMNSVSEKISAKRVFIIHGWEGYPEEGWFPWLKKELEKGTIPSGSLLEKKLL
jgi:hypothetical protein